MDDLSQGYAAICQLKFPTATFPGATLRKHVLNKTTSPLKTYFNLFMQTYLQQVYQQPQRNTERFNAAFQIKGPVKTHVKYWLVTYIRMVSKS